MTAPAQTTSPRALPARHRDRAIAVAARRAALAVCSLLIQVPTCPAEQPAALAAGTARPRSLSELMRTMADTPGVIAEFVETKHLALLDAPLETRGILYFIPPRRLARHTMAPGRSKLIIDGERLVFDDETGEQELDLAGSPIASIFVDNFIVLFNGDLAELERRYTTDYAVESGSWTLRLVPKRAPLDDVIASITMIGDGGGMRSMVMREARGDRTETVFTEVDAAHHFSSAEIDDIFGEAAPRMPDPATP